MNEESINVNRGRGMVRSFRRVEGYVGSFMFYMCFLSVVIL